MAIVKCLLKAGADPDAKHDGWLALYSAAGWPDVVRALLEGGADPNARDKKRRTPLEVATKRGYASVVRAFRTAR